MEFLIVIEPASGGRYEHRVAPGSYVLGREEASCDIAILSPEVSRQHARIHLSAEQCSVEDLGSTAGTSKDGQTLEGKQSFPFPAEVMLGTTKLTVSVDEAVEMTFDSDSVATPTANPSSAISFNQGQSEAPPASSDAGHYTKGREIARGGMGAILEANDKMLGRTVAMKVVLEDRASEDARMRFIREATVLGQLEHPNIIPIHELGKDDAGNLFYAMKMVEGRTLQAIINDLKKGDAGTIEHYTLDRLLTVFSKVCDAMAFAHAKGVIHRDLKPENVMVGAFGEVLVMDWGLAKVLHDAAQTAAEIENIEQSRPGVDSSASSTNLPSGFEELSDSPMGGGSQELTMDGAVMGSPQYMPPEQAEGRVGDLDERSDVYSLGGILYAILTLHPPVAGKSVLEVLENVKSGHITPPTDFNVSTRMGKDSGRGAGEIAEPKRITSLPHCPGGRVPSALGAVAMKALAAAQDARYDGVSEFSGDVEAFQTGHATSAETVSFLGQLVLLAKRNRGVSIASLIGFVLLVAVTAGFLIKVHQEKAAALESESEALAANIKSSLALAEAALRENNGLLMEEALAVVPAEQRNSDWHYLAAQADTSLKKKEWGNDTGTMRETAPHPTRAHVFACFTSAGTIELRDVLRGKTLVQIESGLTGNTRFACLAFSPDGTKLALGGVNLPLIQIYDVKQGRKLLELETSRSDQLLFGPKGNVLYQLEWRTQVVNSWQALTGELLWKRTQLGVLGSLAWHGSDNCLVRLPVFGPIHMLDPDSGETLSSYSKPNRALRAMRRDGGALVHTDEDSGLVVMRSLPDFDILFQLPTQGRSISRLAFSQDGSRFYTVSLHSDGRQIIQSWSSSTGRHLRDFLGGRGKMERIRVHPVSGEIFVGGPEERVWEDGNSDYAGPIQRTGIPSFVLTDDLLLRNPAQHAGSDVLYRLQSGKLRSIWNSRRLQNEPVVAGQDGDQFHFLIRYQESHRLLTLIAWRGSQFKLISSVRADQFCEKLRHNPDGTQVVHLDEFNSRITVLDIINTNTPPMILSGDHTWSHDIRWIKDGRELLGLVDTGALRGQPNSKSQIRVWDVESGQPVRSITHHSPMDLLAVAPDGRRFAEAGGDMRVRIRDVETLEILREFRVHDGSVSGLAWHPTKPIIATGSEDHSVRLWNLETGERLEDLFGAEYSPRELVFSPSGRRLACVDHATVRVWEPRVLNPESSTP